MERAQWSFSIKPEISSDVSKLMVYLECSAIYQNRLCQKVYSDHLQHLNLTEGTCGRGRGRGG